MRGGCRKVRRPTGALAPRGGRRQLVGWVRSQQRSRRPWLRCSRRRGLRVQRPGHGMPNLQDPSLIIAAEDFLPAAVWAMCAPVNDAVALRCRVGEVWGREVRRESYACAGRNTGSLPQPPLLRRHWPLRRQRFFDRQRRLRLHLRRRSPLKEGGGQRRQLPNSVTVCRCPAQPTRWWSPPWRAPTSTPTSTRTSTPTWTRTWAPHEGRLTRARCRRRPRRAAPTARSRRSGRAARRGWMRCVSHCVFLRVSHCVSLTVGDTVSS